MLQAMKEKLSGWITWTIVIIISLIFVLWGIQAHFAPSVPQAKTMITVGDHAVTKQDIRNRINQLRRQSENQDLSGSELRKQAIQSLVRERILIEGTKQLGAGISDQQAEQLIYDLPAFQKNGQFSMQKYEQTIQRSGINTATLRNQMADRLMLRQIRFGLTDSIMVLPEEKNRIARLFSQQRMIKYADFKSDAYRSGIEVNLSDMKKYYKDHKKDYMDPPKVKLNYIRLDMDQIKNRIHIDKDELLAHYRSEKQSYTQPEKRKAADILITLPEQPSEQTIQKRRNKAQMIKNKLEQGASFSKLAKKYSEDEISKRQGGKIGWVSLPDNPNRFEKKLYEMKREGSIAGPVKTQDGYHIIKLLKIRPEKVKPFAQVKSKIKSQLTKQKAEVLFSSLSNKMGRLAFENPDSLKVPASQLDLSIQQTPFFSQKGLDKGLAQYDKVVQAAFSKNVLKKKNNSDPINIDDGEKVIIHLNNYQKPHPRPFNEVKDQVRQLLVSQKAHEKAYQDAKKLKNQLNTTENGHADKIIQRDDIQWQTTQVARQDPQFKNKVLTHIFSSPVSGRKFGNHYQLINVSKKKVMIFAVENVRTPSNKVSQNAMIADMMLENMKASMLSDAYYQSLKNQVNVEYENASDRP